MRYYLGIDNGGTTTKAALFDELGRQILAIGEDSPAEYPQAGFVERDMELLWMSNVRVIRRLLHQSGIDAKEIRALAVCGHGKGLYLWGVDEKPMRTGILSADRRGLEYELRFREDGTESRAFEYTCQHIMGCQPLPLLAWLKEHEPKNYGMIRHIFSCKDYIRFRLTGEAYAERTDSSGNGVLNLYTGEYDSRILSLFGMGELEDKFPPLRNATDICGYVTREAAALTGLAEGTPVAGGMFDIDACALSAAVTNPGHVCMVAGTWSINETVLPRPVTDGRVRMNSLFCIPDRYLVEESSATSAGNLAWYLKTFEADTRDVYETVNREAAGIGADAAIPIFLPFILGSNESPYAKGSFIGIRADHTRAHFVRSVFEGVAFCHRRHFERLQAATELSPESIRLVGGAANSPLWVQIFADVMKLPVETSLVDESGAHGCAIAAATAVGDQPDILCAVRAMTHLDEVVYPKEENLAAYDRKYARYKAVVEAMDPVWPELAD